MTEAIVVSDANIFIDLFASGCLNNFFDLPWEIHTTRAIMQFRNLVPILHKFLQKKQANLRFPQKKGGNAMLCAAALKNYVEKDMPVIITFAN